VTLEQSAKINARIGELGPTVPSGHELTAQINQEFGLNWGEHAIWRRARKAGHYWPGGTEPRLTPERSRQVDARLRERIEAGMPGTEIVKTINGEIGQALTLPAYFARAQRLNLQLAAYTEGWAALERDGKLSSRSMAGLLRRSRL
jgi:hypothetical protein